MSRDKQIDWEWETYEKDGAVYYRCPFCNTVYVYLSERHIPPHQCRHCGAKPVRTLYMNAEELYNAGYRKTSEVVREIFEDIFYHTYYSHGRLIIEHSTLLALQKKYTESEKDNG